LLQLSIPHLNNNKKNKQCSEFEPSSIEYRKKRVLERSFARMNAQMFAQVAQCGELLVAIRAFERIACVNAQVSSQSVQSVELLGTI
jgi:hypothetical protein